MDDRETIVKFLEAMSTQDNRATAWPFFYVIRSPLWLTAPDGCGDRYVYVRVTDSEDRLSEEEYDKLPGEGEKPNENDVTKANYERLEEVITWEEHGMFLTETDAAQHLKLNSYHYGKDAHTYLKHVWRAPELEAFLKALFSHFGVARRKDPMTL